VREDLTKTLFTPRLRIEPLTPRLGAIAQQGPGALAEAIDADVPPEWSNAGGLRLLARTGRELSRWAERALVVHRGDERVIGDLKFEPVTAANRDTIELGYSITALYRRQGYASEAAAGLLAWAFEEAGIVQVIAGCHRGNKGSVCTLRKLGFWLDGARGDDFWWTLSPELYAKQQAGEI
jgi:ribosomal-protein-alanine N-acetyltransferase